MKNIIQKIKTTHISMKTLEKYLRNIIFKQQMDTGTGTGLKI